MRPATMAGVILIAACWFVVAFVLSAEHAKTMGGALKQSDGLVRLFEQNTVDVLARADRTLLFLRKSFEDDPIHFDLRSWATRASLVNDETLQISLIGADGFQVASTTDYRGPPLYLGDREHFRKQLDPAIDKLFISEPVLGRASGKMSLQFSRRLRGLDGGFAGVIVISIDPNFIERFYRTVDLGAEGSVILRNADGVILAAQGLSGNAAGRQVKPQPFLDAVAQSRSGHYWGGGAIDGTNRLVSYRSSEKFPLIFAVGLSEIELLRGYRKHRTIYLTVAAFVSFVILAAMAFDLRHRARLDRSQEALKGLNQEISRQNARFDVALTNMPNGLSMFDADGKLLVWNSRYIEIYGMLPDVVSQGVSINAIVEHRKQAGNLDMDADAYVGEFRQALIDCGNSTSTSRLKDGRTISVNNTATAGGGWVGIHEDITERIRAEQEIFNQATELARTSMRFEAALSNMTQGLCLFDADKRLVVANNRFREMYDLPAELVAPGTPLPLILQHHADRGAKSDLTIDEHVERIPTLRQQNFVPADGREISIKRTPTPEGGWVATHEDVTEQRRQEKLIAEKAAELELMNARFDAALGNMSQGLCLFDADQRVVVSNARYAELYHLSQDQVVPGTTLRQVLELRRDNGTSFETSPDAYVAVNVKQANEIQKTTDGRFISIKRQPMANGGWLTTHEDVTAEKRSERLLAEKATELEIINDRFDAALSNMTQGISMFDGRRRLVVWNARYAEIYQLPQTLLKMGTSQEDIADYIVSRGIAKGRAADADRENKDSGADEHPTDRSASGVEEFNDGRVILSEPASHVEWRMVDHTRRHHRAPPRREGDHSPGAA